MIDSPPSTPRNKVGNTSFVDENDNTLGYRDRPRAFGDGELRLDTYLKLNEDIYSLGFAAQAKNELIDEVAKDIPNRPEPNYMPARTPRGSFKLMQDAD